MSELSELLTQANVEDLSVDQVTDRMRERGHRIGRDTVWKYLSGRHTQQIRRKYLEAFVDVFPSLRIERLEQAAAVPAALGPWRLPEEAQALDERERGAIELLIKSIARGKAARRSDDGSNVVPMVTRQTEGHQDDQDEIVEAAYRPNFPTGPTDNTP